MRLGSRGRGELATASGVGNVHTELDELFAGAAFVAFATIEIAEVHMCHALQVGAVHDVVAGQPFVDLLCVINGEPAVFDELLLGRHCNVTQERELRTLAGRLEVRVLIGEEEGDRSVVVVVSCCAIVTGDT